MEFENYSDNNQFHNLNSINNSSNSLETAINVDQLNQNQQPNLSNVTGNEVYLNEEAQEEEYENISVKMLKMLSAYDASTKRMNIVNSFKRAGIISDYSDKHLKMYVDINAADVFLNEYPEIKIIHVSIILYIHIPLKNSL